MSELLLQKVLAKLDFLCLEYHAEGYFSCVGEPPAWAVELFSCIRNRFPRILPIDISFFLENFMIDAVEFWQSQNQGILRSGYWTESSSSFASNTVLSSREEVNLEALVLSVEDRNMLLLEVSAVRFDETYKWLQLARTERLDSMLERKANAAQMTSLSLYDSLTGCANDQSFTIQLAQWLGQLRQGTLSKFVLLIINVDRFRDLNFSLGIERGDQCLVQIAKRIKLYLGELDGIARLDADEFAVLASVPNGLSLASWVGRLKDNLCSPYQLGKRQIYVTVSLGVLKVKEATWDVERCLLNASAALRQAKTFGRGQLVIFDNLIQEKSLDVMRQEQYLFNVLAQSSFHAEFRPVFSMPAQKLVGIETVLDWPLTDSDIEDLPPLDVLAHLTGLSTQWTTAQVQACTDFSRNRPSDCPLTFIFCGPLNTLLDPQFQQSIDVFNQTLQQGDQVWFKCIRFDQGLFNKVFHRAVAFSQSKGMKLCMAMDEFSLTDEAFLSLDSTLFIAIAIDATSFPFSPSGTNQLRDWKTQYPQGIIFAEHIDEKALYDQACAVSDLDFVAGTHLSSVLPQKAIYQLLGSP